METQNLVCPYCGGEVHRNYKHKHLFKCYGCHRYGPETALVPRAPAGIKVGRTDPPPRPGIKLRPQVCERFITKGEE